MYIICLVNHYFLCFHYRICDLPQYIVLSCMLGFLGVSVFLRMPIMIKSLLLCAMALVYVLLIELSHKVEEYFNPRIFLP